MTGSMPARFCYLLPLFPLPIAAADLDCGPIICQDVTHVTHRDGVKDMVRKASSCLAVYVVPLYSMQGCNLQRMVPATASLP